MNLFFWTITSTALIQTINPYLLPIGPPGRVNVSPDKVVRTIDGRSVEIADIAAAADGHRFLYLGESHTTQKHHQMQADVIQALVDRGRDVVVGFEMFTRPVQPQLNPWTMGLWTEEQFIERADWKGQWGFDFALYRPIFEVTKRHRLPMVALNVPRDWVRRVGREGPKALTEAERYQVPVIDTGNKDHRSVFNALMGGHPPTGDRGENIYSAQVLWDVGMADSALKYLEARTNTAKTIFVVVAGSGHVMYGQGINYRIWKRTGEKGITVTMIEAEESVEVSRGLGDFVYAAGKA